ncbi:hypothetical protein [Bacillus sp. NEB1478]|uniref:hypothetical protein n=1 Tax=Bacillus sp. NEB1478 TaxID=3073816 RepID=UPI002872DA41|nr:hypothetical protein [Bacillus sp. NEB1478]WNB91343.1 hypothetical protein RGB74_15775 [Bacillus sp. NEB1478]
MNHRNADPEAVNRTDKSMHELCKQHMYYHVIAQTSGGQQVEGIITDLDHKNVYMLVPQYMMPADEEQQGAQQQPEEQMTLQSAQQSGQVSQQIQRQWNGGPHYRRYYRQIFPVSTIVALSLYPLYYTPYPYPAYPSPYSYPYYPY